MAWAGLGAGIAFAVVNAYQFGHLDFIDGDSQPEMSITTATSGGNLAESDDPELGNVAPSSLEVYEDEDLGFSIKFPSTWQVDRSVDEATVLFYSTGSIRGFVPNMTVVTGEFPEEIARSAYYEGEVERLTQSLPNVEIVEVADVSVDGIPARGIMLETTEDGLTVAIARMLVLLDDRRVYELTFFAETEAMDEMATFVTEIFTSFDAVG